MARQAAAHRPMGDPTTELARLVLQCRTRLAPASGATTGRASVVSQEVAAQLVKCSLQWYRRLESGRPSVYSEAMMEGVARGLQMSESERYLLFWLGTGRSAPGVHPMTAALEASLVAMVDAARWPAWITDPAGLISTRNQYLDEWVPGTAGTDNFVQWVISDPAARQVLPEWKTTWLPAAVAYVKMTIAIIPKDERVQALVRDLAKCAPARELWENAAVERIQPGADIALRTLYLNVKDRPIEVALTVLSPPGASEARLVQLIPVKVRKRK
ncbi:MmyB family transcriptional regulator [Longispora urticae]